MMLCFFPCILGGAEDISRTLSSCTVSCEGVEGRLDFLCLGMLGNSREGTDETRLCVLGRWGEGGEPGGDSSESAMVRLSDSDESESESSISEVGIQTLKPLLDDTAEGADGSDWGRRLVDFLRGLVSSSAGLASSASLGSSRVIWRDGRPECGDAGFLESLFALVRLRLDGEPVLAMRTASSRPRGVRSPSLWSGPGWNICSIGVRGSACETSLASYGLLVIEP